MSGCTSFLLYADRILTHLCFFSSGMELFSLLLEPVQFPRPQHSFSRIKLLARRVTPDSDSRI